MLQLGFARACLQTVRKVGRKSKDVLIDDDFLYNEMMNGNRLSIQSRFVKVFEVLNATKIPRIGRVPKYV